MVKGSFLLPATFQQSYYQTFKIPIQPNQILFKLNDLLELKGICMLEITIYEEDIINLQKGHTLIMHDGYTGKPMATIKLEIVEETIKCSTKLPTESLDKPVSNCS